MTVDVYSDAILCYPVHVYIQQSALDSFKYGLALYVTSTYIFQLLTAVILVLSQMVNAVSPVQPTTL